LANELLPSELAVLYYPEKKPWIIKTLAEKFTAEFNNIGQPTKLITAPAPGFQFYYHFNYQFCKNPIPGTKNFTYVTHIDMSWKLALLKAQADAGVVGICMSEDTARRIRELTDSKNFVGITPPALRHDVFPDLNILIASRLYEDGRKNLNIFQEALNHFDGQNINLYIIGTGWEDFILSNKNNFKEINYQPQFSEDVYRDFIRRTNLLIYAGFDEGAISVLDYLAAGKDVLATAQGYHLDLLDCKRLHLFSTRDTLQRQIKKIVEARESERVLHDKLTDWGRYCRSHIEIFKRA